MNHFIGLDGHKNSCTFVVLNEKGKIERKAVLATDQKQLLQFIKSIPGRNDGPVQHVAQVWILRAEGVAISRLKMLR